MASADQGAPHATENAGEMRKIEAGRRDCGAAGRTRQFDQQVRGRDRVPCSWRSCREAPCRQDGEPSWIWQSTVPMDVLSQHSAVLLCLCESYSVPWSQTPASRQDKTRGHRRREEGRRWLSLPALVSLAGPAGGFVCDSSVAVDAEADKLSALRRSDVTSRRWMGCRLYKNTPSCWVAAPAFQSGDGDSVQVWLKIARSTGLVGDCHHLLRVVHSDCRRWMHWLWKRVLQEKLRLGSSWMQPWRHLLQTGGKLRAAVFAHASQTIFLLQKFCRVDHAAVTAPELDPCATPIGASIDRKPQVREILDLLEKRLLKVPFEEHGPMGYRGMWYISTHVDDPKVEAAVNRLKGYPFYLDLVTTSTPAFEKLKRAVTAVLDGVVCFGGNVNHFVYGAPSREEVARVRKLVLQAAGQAGVVFSDRTSEPCTSTVRVGDFVISDAGIVRHAAAV
ncbi:hypothetical protein PHYSODRAFT_342835 [Phytophthora sojae]|uniref:Uncharacterized protein n=1 Tax=Phytophthora sojae (strain P6497) TaxID=1094619 RepID=G5AHS3_PHYSP|nr:hypothetical protein PHYSODRAFT_342835 [Phytophthora sojae]EGZ04994.1 hypothetical protein PHYSODRAFT_342835 [Phytophthora sojae]|eukprot:XP_009539624.1 hypothetical protein PHYSODRAFT_342835 [Phytophthora sojae]